MAKTMGVQGRTHTRILFQSRRWFVAIDQRHYNAQGCLRAWWPIRITRRRVQPE